MKYVKEFLEEFYIGKYVDENQLDKVRMSQVQAYINEMEIKKELKKQNAGKSTSECMHSLLDLIPS